MTAHEAALELAQKLEWPSQRKFSEEDIKEIEQALIAFAKFGDED